jgi:multidrug efflux pump subunit AcrB
LAPAEDQGVLFSFINAPEHTNLDYLTTYTDQLTGIFMDVPERQNLFAINGFPTSHGAFMGLIMSRATERSTFRFWVNCRASSWVLRCQRLCHRAFGISRRCR